jgi:hypothetical protein
MPKFLVMAFCAAGPVLAASGGMALAQSQQCQAAMAAWQQQVANYNARCGNVQPGSAAASACAAEYQQLMASRPNC